MSNSPVWNAATITAIVAAFITLLLAFGVPLTEQTRQLDAAHLTRHGHSPDIGFFLDVDWHLGWHAWHRLAISGTGPRDDSPSSMPGWSCTA